jgi:hypothetical protein
VPEPPAAVLELLEPPEQPAASRMLAIATLAAAIALVARKVPSMQTTLSRLGTGHT